MAVGRKLKDTLSVPKITVDHLTYETERKVVQKNIVQEYHRPAHGMVLNFIVCMYWESLTKFVPRAKWHAGHRYERRSNSSPSHNPNLRVSPWRVQSGPGSVCTNTKTR